MGFELTQGQPDLKNKVRELVERECRPKALGWDTTGEFAWGSLRKRTEAGLSGLIGRSDHSRVSNGCRPKWPPRSRLATVSSTLPQRSPEMPCRPSSRLPPPSIYTYDMMLPEVMYNAVQIHGWNGYIKGNPVEYMYRAARGQLIAGCTTQMIRNYLGGAITKLRVDQRAGG